MSPEDIVRGMKKELLEVENGKIKRNSESFLRFRAKNFYIWGDVQEILELVENLMDKFNLTSVNLFAEKISTYSEYMRDPT